MEGKGRKERKERRIEDVRHPLPLVLLRRVLKRLAVDVHQQLERVVSEVVNLTVPVSVRVGVKGGVDDREDGVDVLADEVDDVLVVPVVEGAFGDLSSMMREVSVGRRGEGRGRDEEGKDEPGNAAN